MSDVDRQATARVVQLYRYPVKGLSPEPLDSVTLTAGQAIPLDRAFALAHGTAPFDPTHPEPLPKSHFLMLERIEKLALLTSVYDDSSGKLMILRDGKQVAAGNLNQPVGRTLIQQFFKSFLGDQVRGMPRLVSAPGHQFSDVGENWISIINLRSVADLERLVDTPVDPMRFRANIYLDDLPVGAELSWVDREVTLGSATLRVVARTARCAAVNVNPATAARDIQIPRILMRNYGHLDVGVYAEVVNAGSARVGDLLTLAEAAA